MSSIFEPVPSGQYSAPVIKGNLRVKVPITVKNDGKMYTLNFPYSKPLLEKVKMFKNRTWIPESKSWRVPIEQRNNFNLRRVLGENVFGAYDIDPSTVEMDFTRPLFDHQVTLFKSAWVAKRVIWAAEMGTGKTLAAIELIERAAAIGHKRWWWVGPKAALVAVKADFRKWNSKVMPVFMTYNALTKEVVDGMEPPDGVIFDESSKLKNAHAKRTQLAMALADAIREDKDGYVVLMSGTPAPKSPVDWWAQTETCCPGFLLEGSDNALKYSMAHIKMMDGIGGSSFPKLISWKDSEKVCDVCGMPESSSEHISKESPENVRIQQQNNARKIKEAFAGDDMALRAELAKEQLDLRERRQRALNSVDPIKRAKMHAFVPGKNEVHRLYRRMKGLTTVVFKKDCMTLPDKHYRIIQCDVPDSFMKAAQLITSTEKRTITALAKLRELSDGFLYKERVNGSKPCVTCGGKGKYDYFWDNERQEIVPEQTNNVSVVLKKDETCEVCNGSGNVPTYEDYTENVVGPKEEVLRDLLEEYEDVGRVVIFAGFTAALDKCVKVCQDSGWDTICVDKRGWRVSYTDERTTPEEAYNHFKSPKEFPNPTAIILHPASGGMGLTLTESPVEIFYSNDFNGESRQQAEDRGHRTGMDLNKGLTIIDIQCLPTDAMVLENLRKKKKLQDLSMGVVSAALGVNDEPART